MSGRIQKDVSSGYRFAAVTPHNSTNLPAGVRGIYVGTGGNLVAVDLDDNAVTFTAVVGGTLLPIQVKRINSTSTTASNIVALY